MPRISWETLSKVYDSKFACLMVGASFRKGSLIKESASMTCLPGNEAEEVRKKFSCILRRPGSFVLPKSKGILCLAKAVLRYWRSKSMTFQPVMMSGSSFSRAALKASMHLASSGNDSVLLSLCLVTMNTLFVFSV